MSVIITGMEMPETCGECRYLRTRMIFDGNSNLYTCRMGAREIHILRKRANDCPLKSVNELNRKIESEIESLRERNTILNIKSGGYATTEIQNISGNIKGLLDSAKIIKKYCEMEGL